MNLLNLATQIATVSFSSSSAQTVISAQVGSRVNVYAGYVMVGGATNMTFNDGVNADGPLPMAANQGITFDTKTTGEPWFQTAVGSGFQITTSSAVTTVGRLYFTRTS